MMSRGSIAYALITLLLLSPAALAEEATSGLTLHRTRLKTTSDPLVLGGSDSAAFSRTTFACPTRPCTVRAEVTAQFYTVTGLTAIVIFKVDGSALDIRPSHSIPALITSNPVAAGGSHTVTVMKQGLKAGKHTLDVSMRVLAGGGSVDYRTLTVQTYTP